MFYICFFVEVLYLDIYIYIYVYRYQKAEGRRWKSELQIGSPRPQSPGRGDPSQNPPMNPELVGGLYPVDNG